MAESYCVQADLYAFGVPRGSVPNPGRLSLPSARASTDALDLDVHGFDLNSAVTVRAESGDALPVPLAPSTTYYAIPVTESSFKLATAPDGPPIDLTTDGGSVIVIAPLPVAQAIAWASRVLDESLPEHVVPLTAPFAQIVIMTCAELAAAKLVGVQGSTAKSLADLVVIAGNRVARWAAGVPIRGENAPPAAGLSATRAASDATGWRTFGGI